VTYGLSYVAIASATNKNSFESSPPSINVIRPFFFFVTHVAVKFAEVLGNFFQSSLNFAI
jgi:hypothetical protein